MFLLNNKLELKCDINNSSPPTLPIEMFIQVGLDNMYYYTFIIR